jgi:hypothetical protein
MGQPVRITLGPHFDEHYRSQLDRPAGDIEAKLRWLADSYGGLVLLCFERRIRGPQDCHGRLFAAWRTERTGLDVPGLDGRKRR